MSEVQDCSSLQSQLDTGSGQMKDASIYTQKSLSLAKSKEKGNITREWQFNEDLFLIKNKGEEGGAEAQKWDAGFTTVYIITLLGINSEYLPSPPSKLPILQAQHELY